MNRRIPPSLPLIVGIIILLGLGTFLVFYRFTAGLPSIPTNNSGEFYTESADPLITKVNRPEEILAQPLERTDDIVYGEASAAVTIYEFSDFACPYCALMSNQLKKAVDKNPGIVKIVWKDYPIASVHPNAAGAHVAARCAAEQDKFWEYHDRLFTDQNNLTRENFLKIAKSLNLQTSSFTKCYDNADTAQSVEAGVSEGNALQIDGTPYLFINDQRVSGLLSAEELDQIIELHKLINESEKDG